MLKKVKVPFEKGVIEDLKSGERVLLSGVMYTARDAAHKKIVEAIDSESDIPFELENQCIYYVGPCPAKDGYVIGPCGPTSSYRMDAYAPTLFDNGLKASIGKGKRGQNVIDSMIKNKCVYFTAIGGAAVVIAKSIKSAKVIAYDELGAEAVRRIEVCDFPAIVTIDSTGENLYDSEFKKYANMI